MITLELKARFRRARRRAMMRPVRFVVKPGALKDVDVKSMLPGPIYVVPKDQRGRYLEFWPARRRAYVESEGRTHG